MTKFRSPGNTWRKEKEKLKLDCWWEDGDLEGKRFVYEPYINNRDIEDTPKGELKSEKFLDKWWNNLELGSKHKRVGKKFIYWAIMDPLSKKERAPILKHIRECLAKKVALLGEV